MRFLFRSFVLPSLLFVVPSAGSTQQPAPTAAAPAAPALPIPAVGDMAPDFTIRGATRYGLLRDAGRLSDYRGQTVVVWLFFKARTRG